MSATGRQPTSNSFSSDVLMPSPAIAVTRHQRDTLFATSVTACGIRPKLLIRTMTTNAIRNDGTSGAPPVRLLPVDDVCRNSRES